MQFRYMKVITLFSLSFLLTLGCKKKSDDPAPEVAAAPVAAIPEVAPPVQKYLYFAGGACTVPGLTGTRPASVSASGLINRVTLDTGQLQGTPVYDYFQAGLNLWPVGVVNYNDDYLLVGMMSTTVGFRVDKVKKSGTQEKTDYFTDITNLASVLRGMNLLSDGSVLISRSTMVEKFNSSLIRVKNATGAASYMSGPTGTVCATSATIISAAIPLPNGNVFYSHTGTGTNNKVFTIDKDGYDAIGDCLGGVSFNGTSSPATTANPTSAVLIPGTDPYQIIVSTTSSTAGNEQLWLFTVNSSTSAVTFVKSLYSNLSYIQGVSAMTYDSTNANLYTANGSTVLGNTIEKFTYDSTAQTLTRVGTFLGLNNDSQCINSMFVAN